MEELHRLRQTELTRIGLNHRFGLTRGIAAFCVQSRGFHPCLCSYAPSGGGTIADNQKKLIVSRQTIFTNLKSNTMKNSAKIRESRGPCKTFQEKREEKANFPPFILFSAKLTFIFVPRRGCSGAFPVRQAAVRGMPRRHVLRFGRPLPWGREARRRWRSGGRRR